MDIQATELTLRFSRSMTQNGWWYCACIRKDGPRGRDWAAVARETREGHRTWWLDTERLLSLCCRIIERVFDIDGKGESRDGEPEYWQMRAEVIEVLLLLKRFTILCVHPRGRECSLGAGGKLHDSMLNCCCTCSCPGLPYSWLRLKPYRSYRHITAH